MRRYLWLIIVFLSGFLAMEAPAKPIKIATYNMENMFDAYDDPYTNDIDIHNKGALLTKPVDEVQALARNIRALNADVIGLQEVENRGWLERFNKEYLSGMGYKAVELIEGNDNRGIDVAILSRFPLGPVVSYRHITLPDSTASRQRRFSRDLLEVHVRPDGAPAFTVFVAHLKSRSGGKTATLQRLAEARAIRQIWDAKLKSTPKANFVFLADMNDNAQSATFRILQGRGATIVKAAPAVAPDKTDYTEISKYAAEKYPPIRFDYILASPTMSERMKSCGVLRPAPNTKLYQDLRKASDHFPVWAVFDL